MLIVCVALLGLSGVATAQNAAAPAYQDPNAPPPGQSAGPPPYAAPNAPPPGAYQDPNAQPGAVPPGQGYPPPQGYPPGPQGYAAPTPGYGYGPPPNGYPGYPPPTAYAVPPPVNQHTGLYLRLHLGGGFTTVSGKDGLGSDVKMEGGGFSFGAALGGTVAPNLVVFGDLFLSAASDPTVKVNGVNWGTGNGTASLVGVGGGMAYYFQPVNLYVSGTLAATRFDIDDSDGNNVYKSDFGFGFHLIVGKEWWVTPQWGIGVAGELVGASMKDAADSSITWNGGALNVLFSATYN